VNIDEGEWLARAREGDDAAFGNLLEAYQLPVYNLCRRMLGDAGEAEDAAQETFLRAYRNLRRYDPQRSFTTWLLSIASHHCIDRLRRRRLRWISLEGLPPRQQVADGKPGPESTIVRQEREQQVQQMLTNLSPKDRAVVIMRYWNELSYVEIAKGLSMSISAVKSRLHRARKSMAQQWLERQAQPVANRS
jgi:RNA polymerase sigma-70 factor (ECF subfamily)